MNIILYNSTKARNSTVRPSGGQTINNCYLKDGCSITNPIIVFTSINKPTSYNYAYIGEFSRYYFIEDWTYDRSEWIATLNIDVLATWKNSINDSSQLIVRSGVAGRYIDNAYDADMKRQTVEYDLNNFYNNYSSKFPTYPAAGEYGCFILLTSGDSGEYASDYRYLYRSPSVNVYVIPTAILKEFIFKLSKTNFMNVDSSVDGISENVARMLQDFGQYIINCYYVPISYDSYIATLNNKSTTTTISVGYWNVTLSSAVTEVYKVNPATADDHIQKFTFYDGSLPKHPWFIKDDNSRYQFMSSKYVEYVIDLPMFGIIELPSTEFFDTDDIVIYGEFDMLSGSMNVYMDLYSIPTTVRVANRLRIPITSGEFKVDVPITSIKSDASILDYKFAADNARVASAFNVASLNIPSAIQNERTAAQAETRAELTNYNKTLRTTGSINGFLAVCSRNKLIMTYALTNTGISPAYTPELGYYTNKEYKISDLSEPIEGYHTIIICENPKLTSKASNEPNWLSSEYDEIISYLKDGFYNG